MRLSVTTPNDHRRLNVFVFDLTRNWINYGKYQIQASYGQAITTTKYWSLLYNAKNSLLYYKSAYILRSCIYGWTYGGQSDILLCNIFLGNKLTSCFIFVGNWDTHTHTCICVFSFHQDRLLFLFPKPLDLNR